MLDKNISEYNIVVVDDEHIVTSNLRTLLKLEGYKTPNVFNSPLSALEYVKSTKVDLVISDFYMPEINGLELLRRIREVNPGVTLILLTGYADKDSAIRAINEIGLYRYIEKPWDNDDLLLCIKNGLERSYLVEKLEHKIEELNTAKTLLERYNNDLESIVRERTEDLRKTTNKLSAIINHCADGIITIAKDGKIVQSNPVFSVLSGLSEASGRNIDEICKNNSNEPVYCKFDPEKDILIRDYKIENVINSKFTPVEISFAPIIADIENGAEYFVGVIRDITAHQETERLRDDFIATLTHDLRTPLLAAIQTLRFFLDGTLGELGDRQKLLLETMMQSNQDMLGLVNSLLEVYKYESGQLVLYKENFVIAEVIRQCINEIQPLADKKELTIEFNDGLNNKIYGDKQEIKRVILNILGNAVQHTHKGGIIKVFVDCKETETLVLIEDTGIGIPRDDIPRLFGRFSQGTGRKRSTSTGLGLYLSRQIVEAHNGKIWAESELDKGSKFFFTVPFG